MESSFSPIPAKWVLEAISLPTLNILPIVRCSLFFHNVDVPVKHITHTVTPNFDVTMNVPFWREGFFDSNNLPSIHDSRDYDHYYHNQQPIMIRMPSLLSWPFRGQWARILLFHGRSTNHLCGSPLLYDGSLLYHLCHWASLQRVSGKNEESGSQTRNHCVWRYCAWH